MGKCFFSRHGMSHEIRLPRFLRVTMETGGGADDDEDDDEDNDDGNHNDDDDFNDFHNDSGFSSLVWFFKEKRRSDFVFGFYQITCLLQRSSQIPSSSSLSFSRIFSSL